MKSLKVTVCSVIALVLVLALTSVYAVEKTTKMEITKVVPAPDPTITGVVEAKMDPKGAVSDVSLMTDDGKTFKVAVNENGAKMGKELKGQLTEVTAELAVLTYKKAVAEKPKPPSVAEAGKETIVDVIEETEETEKDAAKILKEKAKEVVKEGAEASSVTWVGVVKATKNDKGKIAGITFTADDGKAWRVAIDDAGTKMATELDGQKAEITFELNVLTFKKVEIEKLEKDIGKMGDKIEKDIKTEIKVIEKTPKGK